MKYENSNYIQLSRKIFKEKDLSASAKWLYCVLTELEHRFTGMKENFFFRSNEDLMQDSGLSNKTIVEAKKQLIEKKLIQNWNMHFIDLEGKQSKKKVSAYRILR